MTRLRASEETQPNAAAEPSQRSAPAASAGRADRGGSADAVGGATSGALTADGLAALQGTAGNRAVVQLVQAGPLPVARDAIDPLTALTDALKRLSVEERAAEFDGHGRSREATALRNILAYARLHWAAGPLGDDPGFGLRLYVAALDLSGEFGDAASFEKLPPRLKAIVYSAEKLNLDPLGGTVAAQNQEWMKTDGGVVGGRSGKVPGSTGAYGANAWKCNKLVADAYLADEGGDIGNRNYPFYGKGRDRTWAYQANDLAADVDGRGPKLAPGKELKHFPYTELAHLSADGTTVVEIDEFDDKGVRTARYILTGGVFEKHVPDGSGGWTKTAVTRDPANLTPGSMADAGDIVAFHSAERGESGHTGLNLGYDLFISAMNATEGIGILSINRHVDPGTWDHYDYVGFRQFTK
jgi:hypothetical protein